MQSRTKMYSHPSGNRTPLLSSWVLSRNHAAHQWTISIAISSSCQQPKAEINSSSRSEITISHWAVQEVTCWTFSIAVPERFERCQLLATITQRAWGALLKNISSKKWAYSQNTSDLNSFCTPTLSKRRKSPPSPPLNFLVWSLGTGYLTFPKSAPTTLLPPLSTCPSPLAWELCRHLPSRRMHLFWQGEETAISKRGTTHFKTWGATLAAVSTQRNTQRIVILSMENLTMKTWKKPKAFHTSSPVSWSIGENGNRKCLMMEKVQNRGTPREPKLWWPISTHRQQQEQQDAEAPRAQAVTPAQCLPTLGRTAPEPALNPCRHKKKTSKLGFSHTWVTRPTCELESGNCWRTHRVTPSEQRDDFNFLFFSVEDWMSILPFALVPSAKC